VKILPRAGAVVVAASWLVAVVLRSRFAAVAAHGLVAADSAAVDWELGLVAAADAVVSGLELAAAVVVWELGLVAVADAVVSGLELAAAVVVWELGLVAAADAVVSGLELAAALQAWLVAAVGQVWPFPAVSLAPRGPVLRFRKVAIERLRL
jgi:hypothetical protein